MNRIKVLLILSAGIAFVITPCVVHADYTYTTINFPGSNLTVASGISGGNIVGYYDDASGAHGFLASSTSVPEPTTMLLLGLGLFGLAGIRRKFKQ